MEEYNTAAFIIIDKQNLNLKVIGLDGETKASFGIACGKGVGNKREKGDNRTPEGIFRIQDIQDSSNWKHDFGDGNGEITGAYGPWFIRLQTDPHKGIGIHGTHDPASIGTRATEGCIRLKNSDVEILKNMVYCGLNVIILPSEGDIIENNTLEQDSI
ncbi:MAG: L,D-transpeptidase [Muribaculaceae bacterium]|nr:L,D-transpeptidase [Muribaculaceae bacterium]